MCALVCARRDPLEEHGADAGPALDDRVLEIDQSRIADLPLAIEVLDQKSRVRARRDAIEPEFVDVDESGEQCPVFRFGRARGADRLAVLDEPDPRIVFEEIPNRRGCGRLSSTAVGVQHGEPRSGRPHRALSSSISLGQGPALGILGRASFPARPPRPLRYAAIVHGRAFSPLRAVER